ncbi:MAG: hypothetical protein AB1635_17085 [Acidobacteriota bacterium]
MATPSNLPPTLIVGAQYDEYLRRALTHFFERAVLESEAVPSPSSDGRLAIEPTRDPSALAVRWFGSRHVLRVPGERPFTPHEVRFARAIGAVLAARYRAILNPRLMVDRAGLFRGAIEDRYVGAFFDEQAYALRGDDGTADRVAEAIEILRVAALSSYENQPIATGVLLLEGDEDPVGAYPASERGGPHYTGELTSIKSFFRLADGLHTLFLVARDRRLLDIVDIDRWSRQVTGTAVVTTPCATRYLPHARATLGNRHVCVVLSPSREIKVFAEGAEVFAFQQADWHLLDAQAKYVLWEEAVGNAALARRLFQIALDLSEAREGALFAVLRKPLESLGALVAPADRLDMELVDSEPEAREGPSRRHLLHVLAGRSATELDPSVLAALATLDGATVTDRDGQLLAVGAILRFTALPAGAAPGDAYAGAVSEGARTTAALAASRFGPVLKVSEDGMITFFDGARVWDI